MPTYEYRCKDCGHELEAQQGFHDDPLTECPSCGGDLRKRFGAVGISFKGSGFYKTDSRGSSSSSSSSTATATTPGTAGSEGTTTSSSDSSSSSSSPSTSLAGSSSTSTAAG